MKLPDFAAQSLYLDLGWAAVLTAIAVTVLPHAGSVSRRRWTALWVACAITAGMLLPAPWSLSFWLGMAFQYPSLMLVTLALMHIGRLLNSKAAGASAPLLPVVPAATLLGVAAALYAGAFGWMSYDLYVVGYSPFAAAAIASALVATWARFDRSSSWACCALALAAMVHAAARLPSGNAWDALLDPFLVGWASVVLVRATDARFRHRASASLAA